jgi:hypothetical protein
MFWINKTYEIPAIDKACDLRLQEFADKNAFLFRADELNQQYIFDRPKAVQLKNMFSIRLQVEPSLSSSKKQAVVKLRPSLWMVFLMLLLIGAAVLCVDDERWREPLGISFPLLLVLPYIYRLYAHQILSELKGCLIPSFESSAEGRKEVFAGYANPLRFFLNFQRNAYILFVIVFITLMILWMFGITDRFFKPQ